MTRSVFAGGDAAFKRDHAALVVVAREGNMFEAVETFELAPKPGAPIPPSQVVSAFAERMRVHGATSIALDGHYIESLKELFEKERIRVIEAPTSADAKALTYLQTKTLLTERRLRLPPSAVRLKAQLKAIIKKPTPGGGLTISSPRKAGMGHGDLVSALVLACWAAEDRSYSYMEALRNISFSRLNAMSLSRTLRPFRGFGR